MVIRVRPQQYQVNVSSHPTTFVCIHGHFYQPPRENPFIGGIPHEFGAEPFANFNEKITAECYRPNANLGNYEHINFDLGPTLAHWLENTEAYHDVLRQIITAEKRHRERYGGISNALAQPYNHTILPLANYRDKWTQIKWGIASYKHLFEHSPTGMWLAETACDLETLDIMACCGIKYVVLAPWQAKTWPDSAGPYTVRLFGGRSIAVFFYNSDLSGPVSFDDPITNDAYDFAHTHLGKQKLTLIATDGELYGHHKQGRHQFLHHVVNYAAQKNGIEVITLERYLRLHPPTREIEIWDNSSWSCRHGVSRWDTGCGCTNNGDPAKNAWKNPFRRTLNNLADRAYELYEIEVREALPKPHEARNGYIALRNGWMTEENFWQKYGRDNKPPRDNSLIYTVRLLLEAQYYIQQAFTSCGWFWESFDGNEAQNNLRFAYRAMHLIFQATGVNFDSSFLADLAAIRKYAPGIHELEPLEFEMSLYRKYHLANTVKNRRDAAIEAYEREVQARHWSQLRSDLVRRGELYVEGNGNRKFLDNVHQVLDEIARFAPHYYKQIKEHMNQIFYNFDIYYRGAAGCKYIGNKQADFSIDGSGDNSKHLNTYQWLRFVVLHELGHAVKGGVDNDWSEEAADAYANKALIDICLITRERYHLEKEFAYIPQLFEEWKQQELSWVGGRVNGRDCRMLSI